MTSLIKQAPASIRQAQAAIAAIGLSAFSFPTFAQVPVEAVIPARGAVPVGAAIPPNNSSAITKVPVNVELTISDLAPYNVLSQRIVAFIKAAEPSKQFLDLVKVNNPNLEKIRTALRTNKKTSVSTLEIEALSVLKTALFQYEAEWSVLRRLDAETKVTARQAQISNAPEWLQNACNAGHADAQLLISKWRLEDKDYKSFFNDLLLGKKERNSALMLWSESNAALKEIEDFSHESDRTFTREFTKKLAELVKGVHDLRNAMNIGPMESSMNDFLDGLAPKAQVTDTCYQEYSKLNSDSLVREQRYLDGTHEQMFNTIKKGFLSFAGFVSTALGTLMWLGWRNSRIRTGKIFGARERKHTALTNDQKRGISSGW